MDESAQSSFLDVGTLLESSRARPARVRWLRGAGLFVAMMLVGAWFGSRGGGNPSRASNVYFGIALVVLLVTVTRIFRREWRKSIAEQTTVQSIEELMRLRRWPDAALGLEALLSRPMRSPQARIIAFIDVTSVLMRYERFADAIALQSALLEEAPLDAATANAVRLARVMAILREDRLYDADREFMEMRRTIGDLFREADNDELDPTIEQNRPDFASSLLAGLALVEIYRDVKTGHPAEAIAMFEAKLPLLREHGHSRLGDAYGLCANAQDLLGHNDAARDFFEKATLLMPLQELVRRYPEIASLTARYTAAEAPAEAA